MHDDTLMQAAVRAGDAARHRAPPWPWVGAVVCRDGEIVSTGATGAFAIGDHAEVAALREAGPRARGATLYVTLEPCDHHGNTPPCTEAVIAAGIRRVVVALEDPDAKVSGRGLRRLRDAGVEVIAGVGAADAARSLAPYLHHRRTGRAFCLVKAATSLDGRIAAADGSSRWITGKEARADAHRLRAEAQAVVVGSGTAIADRPALTVRDAGVELERQPLRVLLDGRGCVPATGPLFDTALAPTLVVTTERASSAARAAWEAAGASVTSVAPGPEGAGVDLSAVLDLLGARDVLLALVEGGARLHGALLQTGLVDRVVSYVAPTLLGARGHPGYGVAGPDTIDGADRWSLVDVTRLGDDVRLDLEPAAHHPGIAGTTGEE